MGFSKVPWSDVCLPLQQGGLNISPLRIKNQSLLLKWIWKLRTGRKTTLWFTVISCSTGISDWRNLNSINTTKLSQLWRGIHSVCVKNVEVWNIFNNGIASHLGNGKEYVFGMIHGNKTISVKDAYDDSNQNFSFRWNRRLRIGEQQLLALLQEQVQCNLPIADQEDYFSWNNKDKFTPSGFNLLLQAAPLYSSPDYDLRNASDLDYESRLHSATVHVSATLQADKDYSFFWRFKLPPRILFFLWLLARDRLSSNQVLVIRGILPLAKIGCSFCSCDETNVHIMIHCRYAWLIWNNLLRMCNIQLVMPPTLIEFFHFWSSLSLNRYRHLWQTIWFFCVWDIWKARNKRVFNNEFVEVNSLIFGAICKAVEFYKDNNHGFVYSGNDVYRNLLFFCNFD
ncbi:uncharacterized protein LOC126672827 [Mercurialis annua]|uniref:uncharacterized protein LOC126672827 n=1 Tax=Mercurialis annua TaxID=3986 RepID=UPI002160A47F|nr:uncharacterized protein LOC126672827 [Mercurialis annua]